jgi:hypothetical protein
MYALSALTPFQRGQLFGFADASWADDKSSRRNTLCYVLCCNGAAFSWKSALAPILALLQVRLRSSVWLPALKK